jgi:enoyl-CoA hydratase
VSDRHAQSSEPPKVADEVVLVEQPREGVHRVTLNRPHRLNSMNMGLVGALQNALDAADAACRVVVLTGAGRGFCSGADLDSEGEQPGSSAGGSPQAGMRVQGAYIRLGLSMRSMRQVVVAAVNGPALGGGFALALGADKRIVAESAQLAVAMVRIGLSGGDMGISYLLPRCVGTSHAFELMLTGRIIHAAEAHRLGLVSAVVPQWELDTRVDQLIQLIDNPLATSPFGLAMTKEVMRSAQEAGTCTRRSRSRTGPRSSECSRVTAWRRCSPTSWRSARPVGPTPSR